MTDETTLGYSEYWRCTACGSVLHSPTTGRADSVPCWKCSHAPLIVGELKPTVWEPFTVPPAMKAIEAEMTLRAQTEGRS